MQYEDLHDFLLRFYYILFKIDLDRTKEYEWYIYKIRCDY